MWYSTRNINIVVCTERGSGVTDFIIPSNEGRKPAVALMCEALSVKPVIRASLALGEGTGAVMMFALLDMALSVYKGRTTFDDISVSPVSYTHLTHCQSLFGNSKGCLKGQG